MESAQRTVLYEKSLDLDLLEEITHVPGSEKLKLCIQCGTCSGACPVSWAMEDTPRKIFALVRAGMRDRVLDSTAIWTCASCYECGARCPHEIKITDVMYALKRKAIREHRERSREAQALSRQFEFGQFSLKLFDDVVLKNKSCLDLVLSEVYEMDTAYIGTVEAPGGSSRITTRRTSTAW